MTRSDTLRRLAEEEGFDLVGICTPGPSRHADFLRNWIDEGRHGSMSYLARSSSLERRTDVTTVLPEASSILVVAQNYYQEDPDGVPTDASRGVVARYARGRDYHRVLKRALERVLRRFREIEGEAVPGRVYVDTGPILERELAQRAGIGWFGRNTMLIHPRRGSYFFLGVLLLGVHAEPDSPMERDHCGSCRACLDACPTSALLGRDASGAPVIDANRCISYLTIEHAGPIPRELRAKIGNRIFGCDICQEVCPFNQRFATEAREPAYGARRPGERPRGVQPEGIGTGDSPEEGRDQGLPIHPGTDGPSLPELMDMGPAAWEAFSRGSPIRRAGRSGFRRNVAVALGNWGTDEAVAPLARALSDPDPMVRGHAAWGLGQVGSEQALRALTAGAEIEVDPRATQEFAAALERVRAPG